MKEKLLMWLEANKRKTELEGKVVIELLMILNYGVHPQYAVIDNQCIIIYPLVETCNIVFVIDLDEAGVVIHNPVEGTNGIVDSIIKKNIAILEGFGYSLK